MRAERNSPRTRELILEGLYPPTRIQQLVEDRAALLSCLKDASQHLAELGAGSMARQCGVVIRRAERGAQ